MKLIGLNCVSPVPDDLDLPSFVYKYRSVNEHLFRSLLLNQVWLARPGDFNDPFEPERQFMASAGSEAFTATLARDIREAGVLCLCKSNNNLPMWSYYGNGLRGVAIGYDLKALLENLRPVSATQNECTPRWKYVFDLNYQDKSPEKIDDQALLVNDSGMARQRANMFATKSRAYEHEDECRIVVRPSPDETPEFCWVGHGLYQHAPEAIREIVFGELTPEQDRQAIIAILSNRNITFKVAVRSKERFAVETQVWHV